MGYKIHKSTKKELAAAIKDLPAIPFMVPHPETGVPVVKMIKKTIKVKGKELLKVDPAAKAADGKDIDPEGDYLQPTEKPLFQDHLAAITAAYKKFGPEAIDEYCKQVWAFHHDINSLPPEPKTVVTEDTVPNLDTSNTPEIILD